MHASSIPLTSLTCLLLTTILLTIPAPLPLAAALAPPKSVVVFGGTGYVGSAVCQRLIQKGFRVTGVSRRGTNPKPDDPALSQVTWLPCDATDPAAVRKLVEKADGVVHAVGLLFDVDSGLTGLSPVVSGSGSVPGEESTYDAITRGTTFNVIDAVERKASNPFNKEKTPLCFVSCAEAGWPDVQFGDLVEEKLAPEWLRRYLAAKRAVEGRLESAKGTRAVIYRPSLIWSWDKFDVLPVIPVFNIASALGVPFVDKTVRVETLADAIVAGIEDDTVSGVQRYMKMEELAKR